MFKTIEECLDVYQKECSQYVEWRLRTLRTLKDVNYSYFTKKEEKTLELFAMARVLGISNKKHSLFLDKLEEKEE